MLNANALSSNPWQSVRQVSVKPVFIGLMAIATLILALIAWIALAPIASAVIAQGSVVVETDVKSIQSSDGGMIDAIFVRDGDTVIAGQELIRLDDQRQKNLIDSLRPNLALLIARKARLESELRGQDDVAFSNENAGIKLSDFPGLIENQREYFRARAAAMSLRKEELESDCEQDISAISGLMRQVNQIELRIGLAGEDQAAATELARSGTGTRHAMRDTQAVFAALVGEEAGYKARISELTSHVRHSRLEEARLSASQQEEDEAELQQISRDEKEVRQHLADAILSVERSIIRAPISGKIINLTSHTIGGVIVPAATILEIVPNDEPLVIEAQIQPDESDDVRVGALVMIRSIGAGAQRLPMVAGSVLSLSADRIVDKGNGRSYFLVRIAIDRKKMLEVRGTDLRPGVPVDVIITKKARSSVSYLLGPMIASFGHIARE